tara:strand:- start:556 stop:807 length:252 start_codon:yes stop_codon:yes gene_type:complete
MDNMESVNNMPFVPMLILAGLFVVVSHQQTYEMVAGLVGQVLPDVELVDENGHPTMLGQVVHGLVLALVVHVLNTNFDMRMIH